MISHYPPSHLVDLEEQSGRAASRLCGPIFATSDLESQIIRLEGASVSECPTIYCESNPRASVLYCRGGRVTE